MKRLFVLMMAVGAALPGAAQAGYVPTWVASWGTSQQAPEPQNNQPGIDAARLTDVTVRQVVRLSVGGAAVRLHLSNEFGTRPLVIDSVRLAKPVGPGAVDAATRVRVLFGGQDAVTIPAGAQYVSDTVPMRVAALSDVAIDFHIAAAPSVQTLHPGSRANSYLLHGLHVEDGALTGAEKVEHWYNIAAVDVQAKSGAAIVALGDSITDGHGSTTDGNDRWTDVLARRLQGSSGGKTLGVVNEGIGGNHLLTDGLGVNALARLDRDVLVQSGVKYVFVLEGINDVGMLARGKNATADEHAALVRDMIAAYGQVVARAHALGLKVVGATLTPFVGSDYYAPTPANEADRQAVNAWIRGAGHFDAMVDFDAVVRDPARPERLLPAADSGDHLHPGPEGYRRMGEAVPLTLFP